MLSGKYRTARSRRRRASRCSTISACASASRWCTRRSTRTRRSPKRRGLTLVAAGAGLRQEPLVSSARRSSARRRMAQLDEDIAAAQFELDAQTLAEIARFRCAIRTRRVESRFDRRHSLHPMGSMNSDPGIHTIPSRRRRMVSPPFRGGHGGAGARLAADPGGAPRADRRADRLGQDARRVPRRDRRPRARRASTAPLPDETLVVYVSPLKALSNDIQKQPRGAARRHSRASSRRSGLPDVDIRTLVRTGDTPQAERASMRRRPPHIVVTTPESLYVLLGSESGRRMLATTRTVIVDEIHALAGEQARQPSRAVARAARGADRASRRCASACPRRRSRSRRSRGSWSAPRPAPARRDDCAIVDTGHVRARDLAIEVPASPLEAVMSHEVWEQVYARLADARARASHHARVRQHAAHGRARRAPSVRAARRRARDVASRQHGEGAAARGRAAAEERRAEGAGRDGLARARHRHRRRRPRVPARLAALDRDVPAARGPREPPGRRRAQGAALSAVARRAGRVRGAARRGRGAASSTA